MLRFAVVVCAVGLVAAAAMVAWSYLGSPSRPEPLWVLFAGIFFGFGAAVLGHPKAKAQGTQVSVGFSGVVKTAPAWSTALAAAWVAFMIYAFFALPDARFSINEASLLGRPDRFRAAAAFFGAFYAIGLQTALSGLKLDRDFLDFLQQP
ncbi:MAG: hypothetical protein IPM35_11850 [Myxococcales bacterium]|nr:hypothetical protein [Myxococcales bacterium]